MSGNGMATSDFYECPWDPIASVELDGHFTLIRSANVATLRAYGV
jgi:hypothetical protein